MRKALSWIVERWLGFVTVVRSKKEEVEKMRKGLSWIAERGLGFVTVVRGKKEEEKKMRKGVSIIVGIAILLFAYSASATVVTDGLVSWWTFDEGTGITAYDSQGDNTGTINSAAWTTDTAGSASSGALYFNGSSANVTVPDADSLEPTTISLEAWIKPDVTGPWQAMLGKDGSYLFDMPTAAPRALMWVTGGTINFPGNTALSSGTWYHVVATYDGTTGKVYLDGTVDTSVTFSADTMNASGAGLQIGSYVSSGYFEGIIDEVRIYNKALSLSEVQQNYAAIPEPSALLFLGGGLLGLLGLSRHKFSRR